MAKYEKYSRPEMKPRPWTVHPIWRGIGCLMLIIIPVMSYAGAVLLVEANIQSHWVPVPAELYQTITIPYIGLTVQSLYAILIVTVLLMILGFGAMTIIFAMFYSAVGPPKYGPLDVPPVRRSGQRRR